MNKVVNREIRDYTGRLLTQIPGHGKYFGDEIEGIAVENENANQVARNTYLDLLARLGSDESLHEIGRFWNDERGSLPPEEEERRRQQQLESLRRGADVGVGGIYGANIEAKRAMWRARAYFTTHG